MRIIEFIFGLALLLLETSEAFFDFLLTTYTIGTETYAVYELMFGGGLTFVLTWILISWIADIFP